MRNHLRFAALAVALVLSGAFAFTWYVRPDGTGHSTTIQGAVDLASDGDEIAIDPGTYGEEVHVPVPLTLRGLGGRDVTTIDAESARGYCVTLGSGAGGSLLEGLTLTGVNGGYGFCTGVAALTVACDATISSCTITNNLCRWTPVDVGAYTVTFLDTEFLGNDGMAWQCGQIDPDGGGAGCFRVTFGTVLAEGCRFEENGGWAAAIAHTWGGTVDIRNSVIRAARNGPLFTADDIGLVHLEGNLFEGNDHQGFFGSPYVWGGGGQIVAEVVRNTFAQNARLFWDDDALSAGSFYHANVVTGGEVGLHVPDGVAVTVTCNDSWGNGTNWVGVDPSVGGNFSLDPKYCDPASGIFTVAENSPLLAPNNPCGEAIGAFGQGCGPISVEPRSWGQVKALYR